MASSLSTRRPLSAYMFFALEERDAVRDRNPGMSFLELGRELSSLWCNMSDVQKAPYRAMAEQDRLRSR